MKFLRKHAEGATESEWTEYWYGVVDALSGNLWPTLYYYEDAARQDVRDSADGTVVIVTVRVLEDDEGEYWPLPVRTPEIELAEAEANVEEARLIFERVMKTVKAKRALRQDGGF